MPRIPVKNPIVKIKVALLETPPKTPAPALAKNQIQPHSYKPPAVNQPMALNRPAVASSVPVQAKHIAPRQTRNFVLKPSFDIKSFPENISGPSSKLMLSVFSSISVSKVSPLEASVNSPASSQPISSRIQTMETFRSFQKTGLQPVNIQPHHTQFKAASSFSKIYAVVKTARSNSRNFKPTSIQLSKIPTVEVTAPVASQRASFKTTYLPSNIKPFKMASLSAFTPNSSPKSFLKGEGNDDELKRGYTRQIRHRIAQKKFYPKLARRRGFEGQPVVAFVLNKDGSLGHLALEKTSGHKTLDQAALKAVKKGAPFPEIPEQLNLNFFKFKLPVSFTLE